MNEFYMDSSLTLSKREVGHLNMTNNFKVSEFACKDGSDPIVINPLIPLICQAVRNWFGYPFTPNSAYRTITHNKNEGGSSSSYHIYGKAVDIPAKGSVTPKMLYDFVDKLCGDSCEVGLYNWGIHVGICNQKKRFVDAGYKG